MLRYIRLIICFSIAATAYAEENFAGDGRQSFARSSYIVFPNSAPYSPQLATLGKMLFFDPRLSGAQNISCSTCHNPSFGWESPVSLVIGARSEPLTRHAPSIENLADSNSFFWDGRAPSLERQANGPITHPKEMNAEIPKVIERLSAIRGYKIWFDTLFPKQGLTEQTLLQTIATFERTLQSGWSPFDDWVRGKENAISPEAQQGFQIFAGKARCAMCHKGWAFTDHKFHDTGLNTNDTGRSEIVNDDPSMRFAFKTPGLRNIQLRAPYMHNGSLMHLEDVIAHYMSGGVERPSKDELIRPTELSERETHNLIAFLKTLTAYEMDMTAPTLPAE